MLRKNFLSRRRGECTAYWAKERGGRVLTRTEEAPTIPADLADQKGKKSRFWVCSKGRRKK